eukprot:TRINITY_DN2215_c0_g1_i1.p1 TRINITY_DN2215_c0_g1~~TRINITY_DN2215_c0_g1_i1.p1  ORF type:complete len:1706 (+),score=295.14 TRINITY_DN2215_c0_g1_i1:34-5118(+)
MLVLAYLSALLALSAAQRPLAVFQEGFCTSSGPVVTCTNRPDRLLAARVLSLAGGGTHVCALLETGDTVCWNDPSDAVVLLQGASVAIAVTDGGACALSVAGDVFCWAATDGAPPALVSLQTVAVLLASSPGRVCAVLLTHEVVCWTLPGTTPTLVLALPFRATRLAVTDTEFYALTDAGAVLSDGGWLELPEPAVHLAGPCLVLQSKRAMCAGKLLFDSEAVQSLAASDTRVCAEFSQGTISCSSMRVLLAKGGVETMTATLAPETDTPVFVPSPSQSSSASAVAPVLSSVSPSALLPSAVLTIVGSGFGTSLLSAFVFINGISCPIVSLTDQQATCTIPWILPRVYSTWVEVDGVSSAASLSVEVLSEAGSFDITLAMGSGFYCLGLGSRGWLWCVGLNSNGQLGLGHTTQVSSLQPPALTNVGGPFFSLTVNPMHSHCCVISSPSGDLRCWGNNLNGQLGIGVSGQNIGDEPGEMPPARVDLVAPAAQVVAGVLRTCVLLTTNDVYCWGFNKNGQLGVGNSFDLTRPVAPVILTGYSVASLASGSQHTCILSFSAQVACWGDGSSGQLGVGSTAMIGDEMSDMPPTAVSLSGTPVLVTAGLSHTCVLLTTSEMICWGDDSYGQLGVGGIGRALSPASSAVVSLPHPCYSAVVHDRNTCALLKTGDYTCWGLHNSGSLGLGTDNGVDLVAPPAQPISLSTKIRSASASCVLLVDGEVKCWGIGGIGSHSGDMPPQSTAFVPIILSISATVFTPLESLTVVGSGFGDSAAAASVQIDGLLCSIELLTPTHIECTPTFDSGASASVTVSRNGFGTSPAVGYVLVLPSDPIVTDVQPASGETGTLLTVSAFGLLEANETTVDFVPVSGPLSLCAGGLCTARAVSVDFAAQTVLVYVPALPAKIRYLLVVRTSRGATQTSSATVMFTYCAETCTECTLAINAPAGTIPQCLRCRENEGWFLNAPATACINTTCPATMQLLNTTALRCGCDPNADPHLYLDATGTSCIAACGTSEYLDHSDGIDTCEPCHSSCATCNGPDNTQCTSCRLGVVFTSSNGAGSCGACDEKGEFILNNGTCSCPPGTWFNLPRERCEVCQSDTYNPTFLVPTDQGSVLCTSCPAFTTVPQNASASPSPCVCKATFVRDPSQQDGSCTCPPGAYFLSGDSVSQCEPCAYDTYKSEYSQGVACTPCAPGRTTRGVSGRTREWDCLCEAGSFPTADGATCITCDSLGSGIECTGALGAIDGSNNVTAAGLNVQVGYWLTTDPQYLTATTASPKKVAGRWFELVKCPVRDGCPGGALNEACAVGYKGPACGLCAPGYGRLGQICAVCPADSVSKFLVFLVVALVIAGCVAVIYFSQQQKTASSSSGSKETATQRLKIAIAHLQILGLVGNFSSDWPRTLVKVFAIPTAAATVSSASDNIAVDCATHPSLYTRAIVIFFSPLILAAGVAVGYVLLALVKHRSLPDSAVLFPQIERGTLALLYVAHPGIFQGVLKLLVCVPVGSASLALSDMNVSCGDSSFKALRVIASIYLVVYGFGGLLGVFLIIKKQPERFGFLTEAYIPSRFYWDLVVTVRKMLFVVLSLFCTSSLQLFFGTWILFLAWVLQSKQLPNRGEFLDDLECGSIWVLLLTVTTGVLFSNGSLSAVAGNGIAVSILLIIGNFAAVLLIAALSPVAMTTVYRSLGIAKTRDHEMQQI